MYIIVNAKDFLALSLIFLELALVATVATVMIWEDGNTGLEA